MSTDTSRGQEEEKHARLEKENVIPFDQESYDKDLIVRVRTMLEYVRLTGLYNMYTEYDNAVLAALLCGLSFGEITKNDIWAFMHSELPGKIQNAFFHRTWSDQNVDSQKAQAMPYSFGSNKDAQPCDLNDDTDASHKFIEVLEEKALEKGKLLRSQKIRAAQIYNNDRYLMWVGIQILDPIDVQY